MLSRTASSPVAMERLEDRTLLSTTIVFGTGDWAEGKKLQYTDSDGTVVVIDAKKAEVTATLPDGVTYTVEKGVVKINGNTEVEKLDISPDNKSASVEIKTTKPDGVPGANDRVDMGDVQINGDMSKFGGPKADFTDADITSTGVVNQVTVGNMDTTTVSIGGTPDSTSSFTGGNLFDADITFDGNVKVFKVESFDGGTGNDSLTGNSFQTILSTNGDFGADVDSNKGIFSVTVIKGDLFGSLDANNGDINSVSVVGVGRYDAQADDGSVVGGNIFSDSISATGKIAKITTVGGGIGSDGFPTQINANTVGKIKTSGLKYLDMRVGKHKYYLNQYGNTYANINAPTTGKIEITGGNFTGSVTADTLTGITVNAAGDYPRNSSGPVEDFSGGNIDATFIARNIGSITNLGGVMDLILNMLPGGAIGLIRSAVLTVCSYVYSWVQNGVKQYQVNPANVFGGQANVQLDTTGDWSGISDAPDLGPIRGQGQDTLVGGTLPFDPSGIDVTSTPQTYISNWNQVGKKWIPTYTTVGGTVTNNLSQEP